MVWPHKDVFSIKHVMCRYASLSDFFWCSGAHAFFPLFQLRLPIANIKRFFTFFRMPLCISAVVLNTFVGISELFFFSGKRAAPTFFNKIWWPKSTTLIVAVDCKFVVSSPRHHNHSLPNCQSFKWCRTSLSLHWCLLFVKDNSFSRLEKVNHFHQYWGWSRKKIFNLYSPISVCTILS